MATKDNERISNTLLQELIALDEEVLGAYYDMGRILSAFKRGSLYEYLGYETLADMIDEELSFAPSTGQTYYQTFDHFQRLNYSRTEALKMIREFSFTKLAAVLPSMKEKLGVRGIKFRVDNIETDQINFSLKKADHQRLDAALRRFGAEKVRGRWVHSSFALMQIIDEVMQMRKAS